MRKVLVFLLAALVAQLAYLISSARFWDGSIYEIFIGTGEFAKFIDPWDQNGRPLLGWVYWILGRGLGLGLGFKLVVVAALGIAAWLSADLLERSGRVSREGGLLAGAYILVAPSLHVHASFTTAVFAFFLPFFVSAAWFLCRSMDRVSGGAAAFRGVAAACLLVSLIAEAYAVPAPLIPVLVVSLREGKLTLGSAIRAWIRYPEYLVIPLAYVIGLPYLMPVSGEYGGSRDLSFDIRGIWIGLQSYFSVLLRTPLFLEVETKWILLAIAVAGVLGRGRRALDRASWPWPVMGILLCAIGLVIASAVPFVLAKRAPGIFGWDARHLVAFLFPFGVFLGVWLDFWSARPWLRAAGAALTVAGFAFTLTANFLVWESRAAFEEGVISKLRESPASRAGEVHVYPAVAPVFGEVYRVYEWNVLFWKATGNLERLIFSSPADGTPVFKKADEEAIRVQRNHSLVTLDDRGRGRCAYLVEVRPAVALDWRVGWWFLVRRVTSDPDREGYARQLSHLNAEAVAGCAP